MLQFGIEEGRVELDKRVIVQQEPEADPLYRCSDASKRGVGGEGGFYIAQCPLVLIVSLPAIFSFHWLV